MLAISKNSWNVEPVFIPSDIWVVVGLNTVTGATVGSLLKLFNPLTPNDNYSGRTAPLTSKRCMSHFYSTNIGTEYFKRGIYSPFFFLFKMQLLS